MALNASPSTRVEIAILAVFDPLMVLGRRLGDATWALSSDYDAGCRNSARCFATAASRAATRADGRPTTFGYEPSTRVDEARGPALDAVARRPCPEARQTPRTRRCPRPTTRANQTTVRSTNVSSPAGMAQRDHAGEDLMRPPGQAPQHASRVLVVLGLVHDRPVARHRRVGAEHDVVRMSAAHRARLQLGQAHDEAVGRLVRAGASRRRRPTRISNAKPMAVSRSERRGDDEARIRFIVGCRRRTPGRPCRGPRAVVPR